MQRNQSEGQFMMYDSGVVTGLAEFGGTLFKVIIGGLAVVALFGLILTLLISAIMSAAYGVATLIALSSFVALGAILYFAWK